MPELDRSSHHNSGDKIRPSQAGARDSALTAPLAPPVRPRSSAAVADDDAPTAFSRKERATVAAWLVGPALAAFLVLSFVPSITAPLGHAMRGDSPLASGVLAVLTLVGAAALAAKSLGSSRSTGMLVATVGAILLGIVMIIVTFSASETAELGIPPAAGGIVPFLAPIVPLGLGLAAFQRARSVWHSRYADERTEAMRFAVLTSVLIFALLELGPFGAVRAAARATPHSSPPSTHQQP
jgi:hypothetical protein